MNCLYGDNNSKFYNFCCCYFAKGMVDLNCAGCVLLNRWRMPSRHSWLQTGRHSSSPPSCRSITTCEQLHHKSITLSYLTHSFVNHRVINNKLPNITYNSYHGSRWMCILVDQRIGRHQVTYMHFSTNFVSRNVSKALDNYLIACDVDSMLI